MFCGADNREEERKQMTTMAEQTTENDNGSSGYCRYRLLWPENIKHR